MDGGRFLFSNHPSDHETTRLFAPFLTGTSGVSTMSSSRPSRGGRGRGGGGTSVATNAKMLLKRTAQEAGLDDRHHTTTLEEITNPPLFPDLLWRVSPPSSGRTFEEVPSSDAPSELIVTKRPASTVYTLNKQREINEAFQQSPFYVQHHQPVDVVRHGKRNRSVAPDVAVLESIGSMATDSQYIPEELMLQASSGRKLSASGRKHDVATGASVKTASNLNELEEREQARTTGKARGTGATATAAATSAPASTTAVSNEDEQHQADDQEEEEIEDYTMNYYASEEETDGGDAEATF